MSKDTLKLFPCISIVEKLGTGSITSILKQVESLKQYMIKRFYGFV